MTDVALVVSNVSKRFGNVVALQDISVSFAVGGVHAVIGPNGAGKTTLFNILAGELKPTSGQVVLGGRSIEQLDAVRRPHIGIARSFQVTNLFQQLSALENVRLACSALDRFRNYDFLRRVHRDDPHEEQARRVLRDVGLADYATASAAQLSHGRQRLLEVALALAPEPDLLLLDEPTAGMGVEDIKSMQELIRRTGERCTVLLIEHNVPLVMEVANTLTVLDHGHLLISGLPEMVASDDRVRRAYLGIEE